MSSVQFFRHTNTSVVQQWLRNHFPASAPIFHRIRSPQNIPERHTVLLANFPPIYSGAPQIDSLGPITVSFVDRSRPNESQVAIFSTLCVQQTKELSKESRLILADQLRELLRTIHRLEKSYGAADVKPLNYPFTPILRSTASHKLIAETLVQDLAVEPVYYHEWDELIFSTREVKDILAFCKLPAGYEVGEVSPKDIDLVVGTSKVKREVATLLENHNAAILFTGSGSPETGPKSKEVVAWAYLSIDQSLTTLYVLPSHRGKGLAKIVAGSVMRDLFDGFVVGEAEEKTQSEWCLAQVAADNSESQGLCKSLGASLNKRTVSLGFNLDIWIHQNS
jgi:FR47-like protein